MISKNDTIIRKKTLIGFYFNSTQKTYADILLEEKNGELGRVRIVREEERERE